jgi:IclR family transcriptional regulator, acetate operon repressor
LCKSLHDIRRQGCAVGDEETLIGLRCISAVVYDDCSEPQAAISVSGKAFRVPNDRLLILGKLVQEVTTELTTALGGPTPDARRKILLSKNSRSRCSRHARRMPHTLDRQFMFENVSF